MTPASNSILRALARSRTALLLLWGAALLRPAPVMGQGPLTPSGAPSPSLKSLAQIDPGTPISSAGTSISTPGYYYLTGNLTGTGNGLVVNASGSGAVIDLRGFTISTPSTTSGSGVLLGGGTSNVVVRNGQIRGPFQYGIDGRGNTSCTFENLLVGESSASGLTIGQLGRVRDCTVLGVGISSGFAGLVAEEHSLIERCLVRGSASAFGSGIRLGAGCHAVDCQAVETNGIGFQSLGAVLLRHCTASGNVGHGFDLARSSRATDCRAEGNQQHGFNADDNGQLVRCTAISNSFSGFVLDALSLLSEASSAYNTQNGVTVTGSGVRIVGSQIHQNGGSGITATGTTQTNCTVADCTVSANASVGIAAGNATWAVIRNHLTSNGGAGNYLVPNRAPTQSPATATNPFANFGDP